MGLYVAYSDGASFDKKDEAIRPPSACKKIYKGLKLKQGEYINGFSTGRATEVGRIEKYTLKTNFGRSVTAGTGPDEYTPELPE